MENSKAEYWDKGYREGDRYVKPNRLVLDLIFRKLGEAKLAPKTALDVGCGAGELAKYLSALGLEVTGFDLSPTAIEEAKKLVPKAHFEAIDFMSWEPDKKFDLVTVKLVYAFMPDKIEFLKRVDKILNFDGMLIIDTPVWPHSMTPDPESKVAHIGVDYDQLMGDCEAVFSRMIEVDLSTHEHLYPGGSVTLLCTNSKKLTPFSTSQIFSGVE